MFSGGSPLDIAHASRRACAKPSTSDERILQQRARGGGDRRRTRERTCPSSFSQSHDSWCKAAMALCRRLFSKA
jgi:hypothetical protein